MPDSRFTARVFGIAASAVLLYLLARILRLFLSPILWAALLSLMLFPVNSWVRGRLRGRTGAAALVMTLAVTLGIMIPAALLTAVFARQATDLLTRVSALATRYQIERPQDVFNIPAIGKLMRWINEKTPISVEDIQRWVVTSARSVLETVLSSGRQIFFGAIGLVVSLLLTLVLLYFLFRDGDVASRRALALIPGDAEKKQHIALHLLGVMRAIVFGALTTALIQGALLGVAFAITGLPSPVVFGCLAALAALIPLVGTLLVWLPAAVVLYAQGEPGRALFMVLWGGVLVGSVDNFLRPLLISGRAQISTLPILLGVMGGLAAFGAIGLFVGPLVIALALALLDLAEEVSLEPGPPVEEEASG
jgi:predicted PurR-regulated permease PerM